MIGKLQENSRTGLEIAVIGMNGRFPGAKDVDEFWRNLKNGIESIHFFSDRELGEAGVDPRILKNPNYVKAYGVLESIECFDADFFGYTPREADILDPQGRAFLECAWSALEDAGYNTDTYEGLIGLYAGAASSFRWEALVQLSGKVQDMGFWATDYLVNKDFLSSRVSYKLNLKGPVVSIQTACSTSLVAIHVACQAILSGECDMALAGGVAIALLSRSGYLYQEGLVLSPDGHCRAFDAGARGMVVGDGVGVVVLKRLAGALADNDHIYAVVKGTAINNDGVRKVGFNAPSIEGEAEAIVAAQEMAEVEPESIGYIETHGTATELGDPVEIEALTLAFDTDKRGFCALGSVKTNVGHLDSAAGITGFIKAVLALKYKVIPPSLHFKTPNPKINFTESPFYVNTQLKEWRNNGSPLRAGVSSFGIGGTNAHAILEEPPVTGGRDERCSPENRAYHLIVLSARTETALDRLTGNFAAFLESHPDINLADVALTLQVGRKAFKYRKMAVSSTVEGLVEALASQNSAKVRSFVLKEESPHVVFMFPGQGAQYVNMGRELYEKEPVFREEMEQCFEILRPLMDSDIKEILYPGDSTDRVGKDETAAVDRLDISHPLLFMVEYALARLLMKWGVRPEAMIGYSIGEFTAACLAGVFSLEDALRLVLFRSRLILKTAVGAMLSVPLSAEELGPFLTTGLSLAVDNGPSCIAAGSPEAVCALENQLKRQKILCMRLPIPHGGHSELMESIIEEFKEMVEKVPLNEPRLPYISNVTGHWITVEQATSPAYWAVHLRETVQFARGMKNLVKDKKSIFVQVGPDRDLAALVNRYIENDDSRTGHHQQVVTLMRHSHNDVSDHYFLLKRIGRLWLYGVQLDWPALYDNQRRCRVSLPTYPFETHRYHFEGNHAKIYAEMLSKGSPVRKKVDMGDWFYIPLWEQSILPDPEPVETPGQLNWLIFIDGSGLGDLLIKRLEGAGHKITVVRPACQFCRDGHVGFSIRPSQRDDYDSLFAELRRLKKVPHKLIHLWGVTGNNGSGPVLEDLDRSLDLGFYSLLHIVQVMGHQGLTGDMEIYVVTDNMQKVTGEEALCPQKATALGAVKIIPLEYPNVKCRSIDIVLPPSGGRQERRLLDLLAAEFQSHSFQPVSAYRGAHRWLPIVKPYPLAQPEKGDKRLKLKQKGVYLITGGFGGMGITLAEYLAQHYKARLILTGRSAFPPREEWDQWLATHDKDDRVSSRIMKVREIEESGAEVLAFCADVADLQRMQEVVGRAQERFGSINGVLHTAGLADYEGVIQRRTREMTEPILAPKVRGTLVLDRLLKDDDLDFLVLFSSMGNFLFHGKFGQVGYNAANEFLDAYAYYNTAVNGKLTISINWNDWLERGMLLEAVEHALAGKIDTSKLDYKSTFQDGLSPAEGIEVFLRILAARLPHVAVSVLDLTRLLDQINEYLKDNTLYLHSQSIKDLEKSVIDTGGGLRSRPQLDVEYRAPVSETEQKLCGIWQDYFGIRQIGIDDDFFELGGDSLKAMAIAARIHKQTGVKIPLAEFFKTPTIKGLSAFIQVSEKEAFVSIPTVGKKEYYDVSYAQRRVWILSQIKEASIAFNMPIAMMLEGEINDETLSKVFDTLVERHESLRTIFVTAGDEIKQKILSVSDINFKLECIDLRDSTSGVRERWSKAKKLVTQASIAPFDLSTGPLLRVLVIQVEEQRHLFLFNMHHIISDFLSNRILIREVFSLYDAHERGEASPPSPLRIHYKDFAEWQNRELAGEYLERHRTFWLDQFKTLPPVLELPTDKPRPEIQTYRGDIVALPVDRSLTGTVRTLGEQHDVTLFMSLLAAVTVLLYHYTGQTDIVVGIPISGREHADLEDQIGFFLNTLALRISLETGDTFSRLLARVRAVVLAAFEHQVYPFDKLVEDLGSTRDVSRHPLFDVALDVQDLSHTKISELTDVKRNLKITPFETGYKSCKFDLTFYVLDREDTIYMQFEYNTDLFNRKTIERMARRFRILLNRIVENPDISLSDLNLEETRKMPTICTAARKEFLRK